MTMETSIYSLVLMMGSSVILLADFVVAAAGLLTVKVVIECLGVYQKITTNIFIIFSTHLEELNGIYLKITTNIHLVILRRS